MTVRHPKWALMCAVALVYPYTLNNVDESDISHLAKVLQVLLYTLKVPGTFKVFREFSYFLYVLLFHRDTLQQNLCKYA